MLYYCFFLLSHILIISTAFIGSYSLIRGISLYAGKFPSESYIIHLISNNETETLKHILTFEIYLYLAGWLLGFILGVVVQYKIRTDEDKKDFDENRDYFLQKEKRK